MSTDRLPRTYVAFVLVMLAGPLLVMLIQGEPIHLKPAGLLVVALLLYALGRGSMLAWALFLLWNLFMTLAVAAGSGGGDMLLSGWLLLLLSLGAIALLLSPSMRRHVGVGRRPTAQPLA